MLSDLVGPYENVGMKRKSGSALSTTARHRRDDGKTSGMTDAKLKACERIPPGSDTPKKGAKKVAPKKHPKKQL